MGAVARLDSAACKQEKDWGGALLSPDGSTLLFVPLYSETIWRHDPVTLKPLGPPVQAEVARGLGCGSPFACSRDGSRFAAANREWVDVFESSTGKRLLRFPRNPDSRGVSVSLSADGKRAAYGDSYREKPGDQYLVCTVWDVDAGREVGRVAVAQSTTVVCHLTPDGRTLLTGGTHGGPGSPTPPDSPALFTQIWDVATQKEVARAKWPSGYRAAFSPDSKLVAVASAAAPGFVLAHTRTGAVVTTLKADPASPGAPASYAAESVAFSPDGRTVAAWGLGVARWDAATGEFLATAARPEAVPRSAVRVGFAYAGADRIVAVERWNRLACAWDGVSGRVLTPSVRGHSRPIAALAFAAGGREVVTGARDEFCRWDAATGAPLDPGPPREDGYGSGVAFCADGSRVYAAGQVYEVATKRPVGPPVPKQRNGASPDGHFLTPDGSRLAVLVRGDGDYREVRCKVRDVATGRVVTEFVLPSDPRLTHVQLTPDGGRLVVAMNSYSTADSVFRRLVQTWDAKTEVKLGELAVPTIGPLPGLVTGFAQLDNARALFATGVGELAVLDLATGKVERSLDDPERLACETLAVSPDAKRVAVVQTSRPAGTRHVRVYDLASGKALATVGAGSLAFATVANMNNLSGDSVLAFSPDGHLLATPEGTSTALIWAIPSAE